MTANRKPDENEEIGVVNNERAGEESALPEVGLTHNERPGEVGHDPEVGIVNNERPGEEARREIGVVYNDSDSDSESS
ncbi:MAG TPA: hypothetical protein VKF38_08330 [Anaerolineaceae bacterium]|nr:hypothetical protein [Anaerolineaceae bacterium]